MQSMVALVNLASYYAIGVPLGVLLVYVFNFGIKVHIYENWYPVLHYDQSLELIIIT